MHAERPETILCGMNVIAGTEPESICRLTEGQIQNSEELRSTVKMKPNPFGDGNAGRRIAMAIKNAVEARIEVEASDTSHDPYIVYALVNSNQLNQLRNIDNTVEILAIYNRAGYTQLPPKHKNFVVANGKILVRAPLKAMTKVRKEQ